MHTKGLTRIVGALVLVWALGVLPCSAQKRNRNKAKIEIEQTSTFRLEEESMAAEGMKYMMMDEPVRALPVFEKLVKASPSDAAGHFMLASALLKLNRAAEALPHATLAYETDPANPYYAGQLGDIYVQQKNYGEAAKLYEKLVRQFPANVEYGVQLAAMYVFNDQFDKAIATYDQMEKSMGVTEEITHQKELSLIHISMCISDSPLGS